VWRLTEKIAPEFEIVELGFRLDAVSGQFDDRFAPIDRSLLPNLGAVPERFDLDVHGIVPGVDGGVGMFADARSSFSPLDWLDLVEAARSDVTVAVPGPPLSISVVFVWALGIGDPDVGLDRYQELIDAGAIPVTTTGQLRTLLEAGPAVGAWSSSGIIDISRSPDTTIALITPTSGLVPLPAFSGILATSSDPVAAHRWLNFRLGQETQDVMTFRELIGTREASPPGPWGPVVDTGQDPSPLIGFDPLQAPIVELDWAEVAATVDEITAAHTANVG
jgi:hypothetical protein